MSRHLPFSVIPSGRRSHKPLHRLPAYEAILRLSLSRILSLLIAALLVIVMILALAFLRGRQDGSNAIPPSSTATATASAMATASQNQSPLAGQGSPTPTRPGLRQPTAGSENPSSPTTSNGGSHSPIAIVIPTPTDTPTSTPISTPTDTLTPTPTLTPTLLPPDPTSFTVSILGAPVCFTGTPGQTVQPYENGNPVYAYYGPTDSPPPSVTPGPLNWSVVTQNIDPNLKQSIKAPNCQDFVDSTITHACAIEDSSWVNLSPSSGTAIYNQDAVVVNILAVIPATMQPGVYCTIVQFLPLNSAPPLNPDRNYVYAMLIVTPTPTDTPTPTFTPIP